MKKNLTDEIKFSIEKKVKLLGLESVPKVTDISLRRGFVRITLKNIDDCNITKLAGMFPQGKIFIKEGDGETRLELFIKTRTLHEFLLIAGIFTISIVLAFRCFSISRRLLM